MENGSFRLKTSGNFDPGNPKKKNIHSSPQVFPSVLAQQRIQVGNFPYHPAPDGEAAMMNFYVLESTCLKGDNFQLF